MQQTFDLPPTNKYNDDPVYIITTLLLFMACITFNPWLLLALYCIYKHNQDERVQYNLYLAKVIIVIYIILISVISITGLIIVYV